MRGFVQEGSEIGSRLLSKRGRPSWSCPPKERNEKSANRKMLADLTDLEGVDKDQRAAVLARALGQVQRLSD